MSLVSAVCSCCFFRVVVGFSWFLVLFLSFTVVRTVLERVGLDGYMLMHLLSLATKIFAVLAVLGCAVIIPVNCYGGNGLSGFDAISMSNVETRSKVGHWPCVL